jgi:TM2 domain-containing membrane protein YozV
MEEGTDNGISREKKLTLILLCWLFGLLGVHRFYTGKYLTGSVYIIAWSLAGALSLTKNEIISIIPLALLFLWWVMDVMRIIMGKFTDKEGRLIVDWV